MTVSLAQTLQKKKTSAPADPSWETRVRRVVIHVTDYLGFDGKYLPGGRQRHVLDLARVVRDDWKRDVLIIQKGTQAFESNCPDGFPVIGLKSDTTSRGDPMFGFRSRRTLRSDDGMLYAAGEDAWPFFAPQAKGVQHGIWWDGPFSATTIAIQRRRVMDFARRMRSVLCVDTNFINWLRCQGSEGLALCNKCSYIPNYADTDAIKVGAPREAPGDPLRILFARRYEPKRGIQILLDALVRLKQRGLSFHANIFTIGGLEKLRGEIRELGLEDVTTVGAETLDGILVRYAEADIAVVPTVWSEGTSLSCVEAICAGVPVVATPVGGLGNVIIPEFNGLIVTPSGAQVADAIERMAESERWRRMHNNCLSLRPTFSIERWKRQVLSWIAE